MRDGQKRDFARVLRREATDVERAMWQLLRDRRLGGLKFRRQVPLGPFVADFTCPSRRLVIELDGGQHGDRDQARDAVIKRLGWRVLRFWNTDLIENREEVLGRIAAEAGLDLEADA